MEPVADDELEELYQWVDDIPLSRPKKNITRDFSDGVLLAEVVAHYLPKLVQLHNYSSANSLAQKAYNWKTLSGKVLRRLGFTLSQEDIQNLCNCVPGSVEQVLKATKYRIARFRGNQDKGRRKSEEVAVVRQRERQPGAYAQREEDLMPQQHQQESRQMLQPPNPPRNVGSIPSQPSSSKMVHNDRFHAQRVPYPADEYEEHSMDDLVEPTFREPVQRQRKRQPLGSRNHHHEPNTGTQPPPAPSNRPVFQPAPHYEPAPKAIVPVRREAAQNVSPVHNDVRRILAADTMRDKVRDELLADKEATIIEMHETQAILDTKIQKLEQLVRLKDLKIQSLTAKLKAAGFA